MFTQLFKRAQAFTVLVLVFFGGSGYLRAWTPGTGNPTAADSFTVDTNSRSEVLSFYNCVYNASENYAADIAWTGNLTTGTAVSGSTSAVFKDDVRRRINFYRTLSGVPGDIVFDPTYSSNNQDAALMFAANFQLSHTPSPSWKFFMTTGSLAASNSNIGLGAGVTTYGPPAIDGYMLEPGNTNQPVHHRRWLLYTQQQTMGTGDIPPSTVTVSGSTYNNVSANAVWITGTTKTNPLLKPVAWPNAGYVPFPLMPTRWSVSYPNADFSGATVSMQKSGTNVGLAIVSGTETGSGDNTLVWEPVGLPTSLTGDTTYTVTVSGVKVSGSQTNIGYNVTLFDPKVLGNTLTISGTNAPFATGGTYPFSAIPSADAYQLQVFTIIPSLWTEGAENSPTPQVAPALTGAHPLIQSVVKRTGSNAFQLAFPDIQTYDGSDESFMITRDVTPSATSKLQFYDLMRWASATTTLFAEVSTDSGNTWTSVWSRTGADVTGTSSWDSSFSQVSASLASYEGQTIKIQFRLYWDGGSILIYDPVTHPELPYADFGFFIDDITVTDEMVNQVPSPGYTTVSGTATSFALNSTTAGAALVSGTSYVMRMRPSVGLVWYDYTPYKYVTAQAPMTYTNWVTKLYPALTGGAAADPDHDGITNGMAFAFGLNPTAHNAPSALPKPTVTSGTLGVSFTQPDGVTGVTYKAEWSSDLVNWTAITDTGVSPAHTFSVNPGSSPRAFFRYKVIVAP